MNQNQPLYIYERREVIILILLGLLLLLFTFTFGVHLGKQLGIKTFTTNPFKTNSGTIKTQNDVIPSGPELTEQGRAAPQALDEAMEKGLHEEVKDTGLRLKERRQVELPPTTKTPNGGATHLEHRL